MGARDGVGGGRRITKHASGCRVGRGGGVSVGASMEMSHCSWTPLDFIELSLFQPAGPSTSKNRDSVMRRRPRALMRHPISKRRSRESAIKEPRGGHKL